MIVINTDPTSSARDDLETEPLFAVHLNGNSPVDAKPRTYDHPREYPPAVGLQYVHLARTQGVGVAVDWLLMWALGTAGHRALVTAYSMTNEECEEIIGTVVDRALGRASAPKSVS